MNLKIIFINTTLIILFIFLISCDQYTSKKTKINFKPEKKYKNSGFALIYNEDLNLKKLDQRSLHAFHKTLKAKSQVKITNPLNASTGVTLYSAIIMIIYLSFNFDMVPKNIGESSHISAVIILGVFCTAIATIIYFQILQSSGATFISIMNYLIPIWAILFGVIFFDEDAMWNYFLGLIVVILGLQLSQNTRNNQKPKTTVV